jgi:DNA-binding winged helix-turn-helix (wHTH) protein
MNTPRDVSSVEFGSFLADFKTWKLYENGTAIPIQVKPLQFLHILLEKSGAVVTREELSSRLWPDTHVVIDQGLNAAARKVRIALRDDAAKPRYVETLGSRGYRFIADLPRRRESNVLPLGSGALSNGQSL